jgi:hypothetical protein
MSPHSTSQQRGQREGGHLAFVLLFWHGAQLPDVLGHLEVVIEDAHACTLPPLLPFYYLAREDATMFTLRHRRKS